jgi:hypothetical protein
MTIDRDIQLAGQQALPSHPADPHAHSDDDKVVGEEVLQTPDYNAPPSAGAIKSTGAAADPGVGGALGQPPQAARAQADAVDQNAEDSNDAELGENQGGGDEIADEMKARH